MRLEKKMSQINTKNCNYHPRHFIYSVEMTVFKSFCKIICKIEKSNLIHLKHILSSMSINFFFFFLFLWNITLYNYLLIHFAKLIYVLKYFLDCSIWTILPSENEPITTAEKSNNLNVKWAFKERQPLVNKLFNLILNKISISLK